MQASIDGAQLDPKRFVHHCLREIVAFEDEEVCAHIRKLDTFSPSAPTQALLAAHAVGGDSVLFRQPKGRFSSAVLRWEAGKHRAQKRGALFTFRL